ncbi:MAG: aldehyde dehydrogenase family protein [Spirochaetia bacterium]|jgi:acyl-CoA reductase-like NAD-dependent aldehyde dehydrogenase
MHEYAMTVDGHAVEGAKFFPVINPATGSPFAEAPECTPQQLDDAIEAAERAFGSWRQDEARRRKALRDCAPAIRNQADLLARILTREQGKPLEKAIGEVGETASFFEEVAGQSIPCDILKDDTQERIEVRRKPFGVVAAILPWNFPLMMAAWKIGQALLTGNTMVLKPSPYTPLSTLKMGEFLLDVLPHGVLNIISGGNDLGAVITTNPFVRKISFTGSVATGKKIARAAAADLKHVTLELGGNDPAIVLPDVDIDRIAEEVFWNAFNNCGQACIAIKRVYVHEDIYPKMVEALVNQARKAKMGDGFDPAVQIGPLNNRMQFERVFDLVDDAKRCGARMAIGGNPRPGSGYFFEPTIVKDISDGTRLVDEEQFGPVLPVLPYRDIEDALKRANATHYGLGGSIWTNDLDRGIELAAKLECGTGWVNQHSTLDFSVPFGGTKWSGIGHELGSWGLEGYTQLQVVRAAKG